MIVVGLPTREWVGELEAYEKGLVYKKIAT